MLSEFEQKVGDFIKANELFGSADKVLLAVSGGADSTALLYATRALSSENVFGAELLCAHINHRLRGAEADSDEDFVIAQAAELKLAITTKRLDVRGFACRNKLSIETAARKLRIKNLLEIAKANDCDCVATAHQKNDNAETILQRLTRGTGFRGLGGIWPVRVFNDESKFVRPLLCVRRDEIIKYLEQRKLKWRQDHTNADCTYRRNYIRHRLLPALQKDCTCSLVEQLSKLSESARRFYRLVHSRADEVWPKAPDRFGEKVTLDVKMLLAQPQPVIVELVRRSLTAIGCGEKDLTQRHYEGILRLAEQNVSGRKMKLPSGFVVCAEYGNLIFSRPQKSGIRSQESEVRNLSSALAVRHPVDCPLSSVVLEVPGQTRFGGNLIEANILEADEGEFEEFKAEKTNFIERFDFDKIKPPLVVRLRRPGDRFAPLGLGQEKKVGKFLTAARVPQEVRQKILIVADSERIIWIWPIRTGEQAKVNASTRKILQLQITDMTMQAK
ncbi:MAG: tRNA lysidine(34) synthetase TilS [Phycisphaerae bacterium]